MLKKSLFSITIILMLLSIAYARVTKVVNYQCKLTNSKDEPINGERTMTFRIYDSVEGGTAIWTETQSVNFSKGYANVALGSVNPIEPSLLNKGKYLSIQVADDEEMTPRTKLLNEDGSFHTTSKNNSGSGLKCGLDGLTVTENIALNGHWLSGDGDDEGVCVTNEGNVGIGTDARLYSKLTVKGPSVIRPWSPYNIFSLDSSSPAQNAGGGIGFGGYVEQRGANEPYAFAGIQGGKESTILNYRDGYLRFFTLRNSYIERMRITSTGKVGIGTDNPQEMLVVDGPLHSATNFPFNVNLQDNAVPAQNVGGGIGFSGRADGTDGGRAFAAIQGGHESTTASIYNGYLRFFTRVHGRSRLTERMRIKANGNVGIGTTSPNGPLHVQSSITINQGDNLTNKVAPLVVGDGDGTGGALLIDGNQIEQSQGLYFNYNSSANISMAYGGGNVGIGTSNPRAKLDVNGRTSTSVLEITGGSDLSEQFEINELEENSSLSPGMVVSIDPESPGELIVCNKPYDKKVAGIISGAGGINPGMLMGQKGTEADGSHPVALTGRVYCWGDASNGSIEPGDLLTTSKVAGHAMKVTDYHKAHGAIIGKAMSSLQEAQGMVLVLVSLQ